MIKFTERTMFICDGIGALLSALMLGIVLPEFQSLVGLPTSILHLLAGLASLYAVYDFCCLRWVDHRNPRWLSGVIVANLSHLVLTLRYLWVYRSDIQIFGVAYFVGELLVILVIVIYQVKIVKRLVRSTQ